MPEFPRTLELCLGEDGMQLIMFSKDNAKYQRTNVQSRQAVTRIARMRFPPWREH